jgi:hypothetical protein
MILHGTFVIKHCKFLSSNEHFEFLFHLDKENEMLIDLDLQEYFQNVLLKNEY